MDKRQLRDKHLQLRKNISEDERNRLSSLIFRQLQEILDRYASVGIYISTELEVNTHPILTYLWQNQKSVLVPKVTPKGLIFVKISALSETQPKTLGILEPLSSTEGLAPELLIIPMLAYNDKGYRLGYGKGYYDQFLKAYQGIKLGLCFDFNHEPLLQEESHDIACDEILTNVGFILKRLDIMVMLGD